MVMAGLGWARVPETEQRLALARKAWNGGKGHGRPASLIRSPGLVGPETGVAKKPLRSADLSQKLGRPSSRS